MELRIPTTACCPLSRTTGISVTWDRAMLGLLHSSNHSMRVVAVMSLDYLYLASMSISRFDDLDNP